MEQSLHITALDGWTLLLISRSLKRPPGAVGAFVLLLQENRAAKDISCSACASTEGAHRLCVMILPWSRIAGPVGLPATWLRLCSNCCFGLIDGWRSVRS